MEIYLIAMVLAVLTAVALYELVTGYANINVGFNRQKVSREDQPLVYWGVVGIKLLVVLFIGLRTWGGLEF